MPQAETKPPGRLDLIEEFLNTVDFAHPGSEEFTTPERLAAWFRERGLMGGETLYEADLAKALSFRESVREALFANGGHAPAGPALVRLDEFAASVPLRISLAAEPHLDPVAGGGLSSAIGTLLAIIYDAMHEGRWQRMKACKKSLCRWAFYDRSKNGSGVWCSMASCGNREKAQRRRHRARYSV